MLLAQSADVASSFGQFLPLILIGAFIWFGMIRPQRKRSAERKSMMDALAVGRDVITVGGLHGQVEALGDETVDLLVTDDIVLRFTRQAIGQVVTVASPVDDELADAVDDPWPDVDEAGTSQDDGEA